MGTVSRKTVTKALPAVAKIIVHSECRPAACPINRNTPLTGGVGVAFPQWAVEGSNFRPPACRATGRMT